MGTSDRWRIDDRHEDIWLVRRGLWGTAALPQGAEPLAPEAAVARLCSWFPEGWMGDERLLSEICLALEGDFPASGVPESSWLHCTVRNALRDGRLVAARVPLPAPAGGIERGEAEPKIPHSEVREEKTWIRIVLLDDANPPRPVPFKRYRVELPDGSVLEGMLDANGMAAFSGIDPGVCKVSFQDFDAPDWHPV